MDSNWENLQKDDFWIDGMCASDYGVIMQEPFVLEGAVPSYSLNKKILGKNGSLASWDGSYANRKGTAKCYILTDRHSVCLDADRSMQGFLSILFGKGGYHKLSVSSMSNVYMMAMVTQGPENAIRMRALAPFKIQFSCKPQRFLVSGELPIQFNSSGSIFNQTAFSSQPVITVYGSGSGNVYVGGTTVEILEISDQIILDCELMDAYREVGDGPKENKNGCISAPVFPVLRPGENNVSWDGGITALEIIPRWWTL